MFFGIIYCAIFPLSKKYYGYTINFQKRKRRHIRLALNGKDYAISRAIRKYGSENIEWKIIEEYERETKEELQQILSQREIYWIREEKTHIPEYGYNMTLGGDGTLGHHFSDEQYDKISRINKINGELKRKNPIKEKGPWGMTGKHHKEKSKEILRTKLAGINHPMFGTHQTEKTKEINRASNTGKYRTEETKNNIRASLIGKNKNQSIVQCPYCKKIGKGPNMTRYHFQNCKNKNKK
jgi:group I intron endonuclease